MATLTRIFGTLYDAEANPINQGVLSIRLQQDIISVDGTKVAPFTVSHDFSTATLFDVDVYATIGAYPEGVAYFAEFDPDPDDTSRPASQKDGYWRNYWQVPDQSSVALGTFIPALRGEPNYTPGSGGSVGPGTVDTIAAFITPTTIGNSNITQSGSVTTVTGGLVVTGTVNGQTISAAANLTGTLTVAGTINGQTIGSATSLTGTLAVAGVATFNGNIGSHLIPNTTDAYALGRYDKMWAESFISTINAVVFKESTQTIFGGYTSVNKTAGSFAASVGASDTTIDFGQTMVANDYVQVRAHDTSGVVKMEYIRVVSLVSGTIYSVSRDLSEHHSPEPAWAAGTPWVNLGQENDGRIEMLAYDGKPRILFLQQGASHNTQTERMVLGNLNGYFGYTDNSHGLAAGSPTGAWIKIDQNLGVRIGHNITTKISLNPSGTASFAGTVTAAAGNIAGWTIASNTLTAGDATLAATGNLTLGTSNNVVRVSADDATYRLWIGHATAGSAPFRVTKAGVMTAAGATVNGTFTSTYTTIDSSGILQTPSSNGFTSAGSYRFGTDWGVFGDFSDGGPTYTTQMLTKRPTTGDITVSEIRANSGGFIARVTATSFGAATSLTLAADTTSITSAVTVTGNMSVTGTLTVSSAATFAGAAFSGTTSFAGTMSTNTITQNTATHIYPGSASGLTAYQTTYYLASHGPAAGLYTNGSFYAQNYIYAGNGQLAAATNGGGVFVLNAAGSAYNQVIGLDGSNLTFLHCNSARLRFVSGSLGSGSLPGTVSGGTLTAAGVLLVAIDGYGNAKIPFFA